MIYVMSDLHGCYRKFKQMLERISFTDADDLYLLGDLIDRGDEPIPLLQDCMYRSNVYPLLGNHEAMMLPCINGLPAEATLENILSFYTEDGRAIYHDWMHNGGTVTIKQYLALSAEQREAVLDYLREFMLYDEVEVNGERYVLTHSGIENFVPECPLEKYPFDAFLFARPKPHERFYSDRKMVFGHTPTMFYAPNAERAEVFFSEDYINIDCGAVFPEAGGRLACLRLDDRKVFYV